MRKYLSDNNRDFYSQAFLHAEKCESKFWDIDNGINTYLKRINLNPNIRTLYSKKGASNLQFGMESYLVFCYSKSVENEIEKRAENLNIIGARINKQEPKLQTVPSAEKNPCLKFINNPEYWNVWNFRISIDGGIEREHQAFWIKLCELLENIGL
jgi:hypothetical protein